jgi:hypothetical protein
LGRPRLRPRDQLSACLSAAVEHQLVWADLGFGLGLRLELERRLPSRVHAASVVWSARLEPLWAGLEPLWAGLEPLWAGLEPLWLGRLVWLRRHDLGLS